MSDCADSTATKGWPYRTGCGDKKFRIALEMFEEAGFYGIEILSRQTEPWPWRMVIDDDAHTLLRGQRMAVCDKTFHLMTDPKGPYAGLVLPIMPKSW